MCIKQVKIELQEEKLKQIMTELEILNKSNSEFIIDFFGAFMVDNMIYVAIEYMNAGSLDQLYGSGLSEPVAGIIAYSVNANNRFCKGYYISTSNSKLFTETSNRQTYS